MKNLIKNFALLTVAIISLNSCEKTELIETNTQPVQSVRKATYYGDYATCNGDTIKNARMQVVADSLNDAYGVLILTENGNQLLQRVFSSSELIGGSIVLGQIGSKSNFSDGCFSFDGVTVKIKTLSNYNGVCGGALVPTPSSGYRLHVASDSKNNAYGVMIHTSSGHSVYQRTFTDEDVINGTIVIEQTQDASNNNQEVVRFVDENIEFLGGQL